jgi:hypothetical protein
MELERLRVVSTWYFEAGSSRYRIEIYEHESRGSSGFHIFENDGGVYRLDVERFSLRQWDTTASNASGSACRR